MNLNNNQILGLPHTEVSELHGFAKEILGKLLTFKLLWPVKPYIKICTKLVPHIKFADEFDFLVETT